jgi:O-antigen/teichoic acid export membrane protein
VSLARAILGNLGATFLGYLLALATGVLTARYLGPEGKGIYVLALLIPHLAVNALTLGVGSASIYFIARGEREPGTALGTSLATVLPLGLAFTLVAEALLGTGLWPTPHRSYIAVALWSIVPTMGSALIRNALLGLQRYNLFNWLIVLDRTILLALLVAGSAFSGRDLWTLCFLFVLSAVLSFVVSLMLWFRVAGARLAIDLQYARQALHYGLRGHVGWLADMLNYRLDMLFVESLAGAMALGLYSAAVSLAETLMILPGCISLIVMPRLASSTKDSSGTAGALCRLLSPFMVVASLALAWLGGPLIRILYGEAFAASLSPLLLLLPGVAVLSIVKVLAADFAARGRPGLVSAVSWISLAVTIVLDLLLIKPYGVQGAAVASSLAYGAGAAVTLYLYWRLTFLSPISLLVPRRADGRLAWSALQQITWASPSRRILSEREIP